MLMEQKNNFIMLLYILEQPMLDLGKREKREKKVKEEEKKHVQTVFFSRDITHIFPAAHLPVTISPTTPDLHLSPLPLPIYILIGRF